MLMDIDVFTEFKSGQLEPIVTDRGGKSWAFIPNRLPSRVAMTDELWSAVADAQQAVGSLEQIKGILSDPSLLLRPLQHREALISSRLEGTYALAQDVLLLDIEQEENDAIRTPDNRRSAERLEVWNHCEALREGHNWLQEGKPLDQSLILHLHKILMAGSRREDMRPGEFRNCQVAVGRRPRRFVPPPPDRIEACMADLVEYMASGGTNGLVKSFEVHYQFEAIHPFLDGNGRVGRVLLSLCVSSWLNLSMPWLYLSDFFEKHKREYYDRLFNISTNGEWAEWIDFAMQGTIEQSRDSIDRCERLRTLRDRFNESVMGLGPRMPAIIDMLFAHPVIRSAQVAKKCGVSKEAARRDLKKLVEIEILTELPETRPQAFACFPIISAAWGGDATDRDPPSSSPPLAAD
jgi:cell filamentation protein, protein adenylyltransferase